MSVSAEFSDCSSGSDAAPAEAVAPMAIGAGAAAVGTPNRAREAIQ